MIICFNILCHVFMIFNFWLLSMICCNSAFKQGNLGLWRYVNAIIIIIINLQSLHRRRQQEQHDKTVYLLSSEYSPEKPFRDYDRFTLGIRNICHLDDTVPWNHSCHMTELYCTV